VDNLLTSFPTADEALQYAKKRWPVCCGEVDLRSLNGDLQARKFNCRFRASPCHPSTWLYMVFQSNTLLDYRSILEAISACIQTDCATKREILRETASVYDPFRFLSLVVLHAKLILQALCRISVNWDEPF
jgi:hypothetical protein